VETKTTEGTVQFHNRSDPEITEQLVIAVSTARSHIKKIYGKLNVHSRYEAVERAKQLQLL
jgi:LuxR family maltose regulon positive regulatory protein